MAPHSFLPFPHPHPPLPSPPIHPLEEMILKLYSPGEEDQKKIFHYPFSFPPPSPLLHKERKWEKKKIFFRYTPPSPRKT